MKLIKREKNTVYYRESFHISIKFAYDLHRIEFAIDPYFLVISIPSSTSVTSTHVSFVCCDSTQKNLTFAVFEKQWLC